MNNEEKILAILERQEGILDKHGSMLEMHGAMLEKLITEQQQTNKRLDRIEDDVLVMKKDSKALKADVSDIKTDVLGLKSGISSINKKLFEHDQYFKILTHQQDNDFDLLHDVAKKVDTLTIISQDHEEKLQKIMAV